MYPPSFESPRLILASASPRRRELLGLLGLPFEVIPSAYEEPADATHPRPSAFAAALAEGKALDVAGRHPGAIVIGADTVVAIGTRLYAKPADGDDAARMLTELSGRTHRVSTGVAVVDGRRSPPAIHRQVVRTDVTFRALTREEITAYVSTGEPLDKAGAYGIQAMGLLLIESVRGDYANVVGLPIAPLASLLRQLGLPAGLGVPNAG